jgi:hypothetical protein
LHASAWTLELIESLTMLTPLLRRPEATRAETTARIKAMVGLRQRSPAWPECSASPPISNLALTSDQPEPDHQNMSSPSDIPHLPICPPMWTPSCAKDAQPFTPRSGGARQKFCSRDCRVRHELNLSEELDRLNSH